METVLHLHQPAASLPGVAVSGNSVTLADSRFSLLFLESEKIFDFGPVLILNGFIRRPILGTGSGKIPCLIAFPI